MCERQTLVVMRNTPAKYNVCTALILMLTHASSFLFLIHISVIIMTKQQQFASRFLPEINLLKIGIEQNLCNLCKLAQNSQSWWQSFQYSSFKKARC